MDAIDNGKAVTYPICEEYALEKAYVSELIRMGLYTAKTDCGIPISCESVISTRNSGAGYIEMMCKIKCTHYVMNVVHGNYGSDDAATMSEEHSILTAVIRVCANKFNAFKSMYSICNIAF
jgi:hypothetical protein